MATLAQQALMLDALTGEMDRSFPHAAQAYREQAEADPETWRWCVEEAARRNRHAD